MRKRVNILSQSCERYIQISANQKCPGRGHQGNFFFFGMCFLKNIKLGRRKARSRNTLGVSTSVMSVLRSHAT